MWISLKRVKVTSGMIPLAVRHEVDLIIERSSLSDTWWKCFRIEKECVHAHSTSYWWGIACLNPYNPGGAQLCPSAVLHGLPGVGSSGARRPPFVYWDLEPECHLDHQGYCKRVDFGIAKYLGAHRHLTCTIVGLPFVHGTGGSLEAARAAGYDPSDEELHLCDL